MYLLSLSGDATVAEQASKTLAALPEPVLKGALAVSLPPAVLLALAQRYTDRIDVLERLLVAPQVPMEGGGISR